MNTTQELIQRIKENVDDMLEGRIDHETFGLRAVANWKEAEAAGVAGDVRAVICNVQVRRAA